MSKTSSRNFDESKKWLILSIGSLLFGGLLSLVLVLGRSPWLNHLIADPLFVKRNLVVHVTLTLGCWFFGFIATLFYLLPGKPNRWSKVHIALSGIFIFCIGGFFTSAQPILSNYIPVIHHPLFLFGGAIFLGGVSLSLLDSRLFKPVKINTMSPNEILDEGSSMGIKAAAFSFLFGIFVLCFSVYSTVIGEDLFAYYEILFWGSGHLFQMANISGMILVWLILYKRLEGRPLLNKKMSYVVFGLLLTPVIISPWFLIEGTSGASYYSGFTFLMRWGTWPSAIIVIAQMISVVLKKNKNELFECVNSFEFRSIAGSACLLILGIYLGARIRESSTLIPAHYHATIGAVTLAYMSLSFVLIEKIGYQVPSLNIKKWISRQPLIFATGQIIFSIGFAYAGLHGLGRKVYGAEQKLDQLAQYTGLGIMGVGGVLAIVGGGLFFGLLYRCIKKNNFFHAVAFEN